DVASGEIDHLRQLADDFGNIPDHLLEIAILPNLAVARERDAAFGRVTDLGRRFQCPARRRHIEGLADFPRALDVARGDLEVAPCQVDADAIAIDAVISALHVDI